MTHEFKMFAVYIDVTGIYFFLCIYMYMYKQLIKKAQVLDFVFSMLCLPDMHVVRQGMCLK